MNGIDPIITDMYALRKPSKQTSWKEIEELNLIERLKASNTTAWTNGVGLAAVQIGIYLRMAWFMVENKERILVNPVITKATKPVIVPREGCLSIPNRWTATLRYDEITITTLGEKNERETLDFSGFSAIIIQHETDHMNGILNLERKYRQPIKIGRNAPCPECLKKGIEIKYKKCKLHFGKVYEKT